MNPSIDLDLEVCREELVPDMPRCWHVDHAVVGQKERQYSSTVPLHSGNRNTPQGPNTVDFLGKAWYRHDGDRLAGSKSRKPHCQTPDLRLF